MKRKLINKPKLVNKHFSMIWLTGFGGAMTLTILAPFVNNSIYPNTANALLAFLFGLVSGRATDVET